MERLFRDRHIRVKKTLVGLGVFAQRRFKKHEIIGEITGDVMSADYESDYCMHLSDEHVLEPTAPFRFLNHSCLPNAELQLWKRHRVDGIKIPRLWLSAVRKIEKGDELTIDYAWPASYAIPCQCRAKKCRGWIVDSDEVSQLRRKRRRRLATR